MILVVSLSSSVSLYQGRGAACNLFTASSAILLHLPLSPVLFFQSPSSHIFFISLYTVLPISVLASLVSSCPADVTLPLSSLVCHPPSFLPVQPTVVCSSSVSMSSYSALLSLPLTPPLCACLPSLLLLFFGPSYFRTLVAFVVVVRSEPRFPFRTGMLV